ncbi:unnamed protein product, partial [marine sediment metagenome]
SFLAVVLVAIILYDKIFYGYKSDNGQPALS